MRLNRRSLLQAIMSVLLTAPAQATPRPIVVIAEGDSLTYGQDTSSPRVQPAINGATATRSTAAYPEMLGRLLGRRYVVRNHGFPGDRTVEGLKRWQANPRAAITILMYGTNDCLNYGGHPEPGMVPVAQFSRNLQTLIRRRSAAGARVIVVAPPPLADPAADRRLVPYRLAAARVAQAANAPFHMMQRHAQLWTDGVHLSSTGYMELAKSLQPLVVRQSPS